MSSEARLKLKLNKKHKLALGNNAAKSIQKDKPSPRENGSKGDSRKKVRTKEIQSSKEQSCGDIGGSEKLRPLDSNGRKKRVYAREERGRNGRSYNRKASFDKKALLKKGDKKVNDELVEENTSDRRKRVSSKTNNANSEAKYSSRKMKVKEENVKLPSAKQKAKAKEVGKKDSVTTDGNGTGLLKKRREHKSGFSKDKSQNAEPSLKSDKRKARAKTGLDDDVEINEQPKKRKRVIRLDPHDISNKRLDDGIVIDGSSKDKKKESEEKPEMSKNAQFRAIQPSPSILSFVEKNLLGRRRMIEIKRAGYNIDLSAPLDNVPFSTSSERERIEDNIFRNKLEFFAAAKASSSFPPPNLPEIAFAGRSNVGKSSLLNALTRQWGVVRTSDKPGLTQTINFFKLGSKLCLVDLPGYGFAYAKEEVKEAWEELVKEYVSTRVGLKRVCLLIDTKWGMKPRDRELIDIMERSQTKYQIVLTKTDVVFPIDVARRAMQIEESLKENKSVVQPTMMVSSKSGAGIRSLRTVLSKIARIAKL